MKTELEEMGMFAQEYKQPIPAFIHRLGVVTAPTGAAVQDIRNISLRRDPYLQIFCIRHLYREKEQQTVLYVESICWIRQRLM